MTETHLLLKEFVERRSESAFRQLVERYINLVYSTALRRAQGNAHEAEEIVQTVFTDFAAKAHTLARDSMLGGWLHRHCCFVANNFYRARARRAAREREAVAMDVLNPEPSPWLEVAGALDEAIDLLDPADRDAIVLRFFEKRDFRSIAAAIGGTDNAAQKRVGRAVDKLRELLANAGVVLSASILAELLESQSIQAAPAQLAETVAENSFPRPINVEAAAAGGGILFALLKVAAVVGIVSALVYYATIPKPQAMDATRNRAEVNEVTANGVVAGLPSAPQEMTISKSPETNVVAVGGGLELVILAADTGQPIPNAELEYWDFRTRKTARANRAGVAIIPVRTNATSLELTTRTPGFADTRLQWKTERGDTIPERYTLKLERGVRIGGKVIDARGELVPGAKVGFNLDADPEESLKVESHEFSWIEASAEDGTWELDRITERGLRRIRAGASHPQYASSPSIYGAQDSAALAKMRNLQFEFTLGDAVSVSGSVVNEKGEPIADAEVLVGKRAFGDSREVKTAADGTFVARGCVPGKTVLTASAKGYAATTIGIEATTNSEPHRLILRAGFALRMRVVGPEGEPVAGANVWLNTMARMNPDDDKDPLVQAEFAPRTDKDGRVEWNEAPKEELTFDIHGTGYMRKNEVKIAANGVEQIVRLDPALTISGTVRDAEKGSPIPKFKIITGWRDEYNFPGAPEPRNNWSSLDRYWFSFSNGKFEKTLEEPVIYGRDKIAYVFKIEAEGYRPEISRVVNATEKKAHFDFTLKPSAVSKLTILGVNGQPATDVDVVFAVAKMPVSLHGTAFARQPGAPVRPVDSKGQVNWDGDEGVVAILVAGPSGFARAKPEEAMATKTIQLQPWGRVEATITRRGKPIADWKFRLDSKPTDTVVLRLDQEFTNDGGGNYSLPFAPSGEFDLARMVPNGDRSFSHAPIRPVKIEPGQTTHADYSENGTVAKLRVVWPSNITRIPQYAMHCMASRTPPGWSPELMKDPKLLQEFSQRPEVKAAAAQFRALPLSQSSPGVWTLDGAEPGEYSINVFVYRTDGGKMDLPIMGFMTANLPESNTDECVDLGELVLTAAPIVQQN